MNDKLIRCPSCKTKIEWIDQIQRDHFAQKDAKTVIL